MYSVFLAKMNINNYVTLRFTKTKHILCRARINRINAILLIDTGASNSCIHSKLKEQFKLKSKGDPFDASGASEGKMTATMTQKCVLHLGRHKIGKHAFVLLDLTHINETLLSQRTSSIDGILGADFLMKKKIIIDYRRRRLII